MSVRIVCIKKSNGYHENPHAAIESLDWVNEQTNASGRSSRLDMNDFIVNKQGQAYVGDASGNTAYLQGACSSSGNPFVRTVTDGKWSDNLLALPECS